jgi:acylphosphatase
MEHLQLIVSGRVQMVRFRVFTVKIAKEIEIIGNVENLPNGTVKIEAWGKKEKLESFRKKISKGSRLSRIDNIAEVWDNRDYIDDIKEFRIIH